MQILTDVPAPNRLLTVAYLALAGAITLPSAKADDGLAFDTELLAPQDDGQREEIERLRRQIADLKKQQAELSKQLAKTRRAEAQASDEEEGEAKAGAKAKYKRTTDSEHTDLFEVRGEGDGKPKVRTYKAKAGGTGAQAFVLEDGELRELKVEDVEGGLRVYVGGDGKAHAIGVDGKEWKALHTGDGEAFTFVLPEMKVQLPEGARKQLKTKLPKALKVDGKGLMQLDDGEWRVLRAGDGEEGGLFKVIEGGDDEHGASFKVLHGDDAKNLFHVKKGFQFKLDAGAEDSDSDAKGKGKAKVLRLRSDDDDDGENEGKKAKKGDADGEKVEVRVESPKVQLRRATRTVHV